MIDAEQFWRAESLEDSQEIDAGIVRLPGRVLLRIREVLEGQGIDLPELFDDRRAELAGGVTSNIIRSVDEEQWSQADQLYELASGHTPYLLLAALSAARATAVDQNSQPAIHLAAPDRFLRCPIREVPWEGERAIWLAQNACGATGEILSTLRTAPTAATPLEVRISSCHAYLEGINPAEVGALPVIPEELRPALCAATTLHTQIPGLELATVLADVALRTLHALKVHRVLMERPDLSGRVMWTTVDEQPSDRFLESRYVLAFSRKT